MPNEDAVQRAVLNLLAQAELSSQVVDAMEPHIVLSIDPESGTMQAYGLYPDGYTASADLPRLRREWDRDIGEPTGIFIPVAYFPFTEETQA
jgi:hypothetical protein